MPPIMLVGTDPCRELLVQRTSFPWLITNYLYQMMMILTDHIGNDRFQTLKSLFQPLCYHHQTKKYGMMEQSRNDHGSQSVMQDYLDTMYPNRTQSDVKPVLNYSIQTGITHAGLDKASTQFNSQTAWLHGSIPSPPKTSFNQQTAQFGQGYASYAASDTSSTMIKCLCSFGGRILPRPSDGKLRYVGGQTRILRFRKDISWPDLWRRAFLIYNLVHILKYQLPGEDLDALVSVSSDEDLQNMMEEYNHIEDTEPPQKLRIFLFSITDLQDAQFALSTIGGDSQVQYVVAVNGMDSGSRTTSTPLGVSISNNDIHKFNTKTIQTDTSNVAVESIRVTDAPLTGKSDTPLATQSSQQLLPTSSNVYETGWLTNGDQMAQAAEISCQYPIHHRALHPSHNLVVGETPISLAPHLLNNQSGILNEDHPPRGVQVQKSEPSTLQVKTISENSSKQGSDHGDVLSLEIPSPSPFQPIDGYLKNNGPEASAAVTMPEGHLPSLPCTKKVQHQDCNASSTSSNSFAPNYVDSHSNAIDLSSLHPPPIPKRFYCSERTPREQVEVLNRSSKSDDAHSSQFNVSDLLSDTKAEDPVTESGDNLHDGNLLDPDDKSSISAKPFPEDDHTIDNGFASHQMNKPLLDTNSEIKSNLSEHMYPELKQVLLSNEGIKDVETKDNHIKPLFDETETKYGKSDLPVVHHVSSVERLDVIASNLPEIDWGEAYGKESNDNPVVQELPASLAGNITKGVSQDFRPNVSKQIPGDILIDIDDRFPRELLSDMYSKAILEEDSSNLHPLSADGVAYSVNMENHEPKSWSYFGKLAQGLDNVSLIDQDHLGFSHHVTPLTTDRFPLDREDSNPNFGEENQDLHRRIGMETHALKSNYDQSQLTDTKSMQFEYEDDKFETKNCNLPPFDPSSGDFDISSVQVIKNEDLEELKELGSGTFGTVYHGKWRGTDVAIKRIKKSCFTGRSSEQERLTAEFWREADILSKLHHPNVVAFYGVVQDGPGGTVATVTEFMVDGSLRHVLLRKDRCLDRRKRLIIAMDAAFGMEYLHSKNIVHFDLKCDNLLVNLKDPLRPICKVGDFGLSKIKRNTLVTGGVRGTLPWMAPELLNGSSSKVSEKVDVFSFGIVLWEILTGEEPYANMHYGAIIGGIVNNTLRPTIPSHCDLEWRTLMEQCWAPNPVVRPSFTEIASRLRIMSADGLGNKPSK
ncbi:unnamed protein product [Vicia faba]|uniref:Protein kinase domain-containing protein n=1 Tax=Vicia faba TaxID=3906 RepID=A0AAV1AD44_VICFA|nr:unnamed protein product [Vicia faba]